MIPFKKSKKLSDDGLVGGYEEGPDLTPTGGEYDPSANDTLRRRQQLQNLLDGNPDTFIDERLDSSVTTGGQNPDSLTQLGPQGDLDAVVFETEQSKMVGSMESELDVLKKTAANIPTADLDLEMGAIETERFERAARQQKVAKRLNKPVKKVEVTKVPDEFKGFTVRSYYENKVAELEGRIAIEKSAMGESYEAQARDINIEQKSPGIDPVDKTLTLNDEGMLMRPKKGVRDYVTNVGGEDVIRPRKDLAAPLNQVSKTDPASRGTFKKFQKVLDDTGHTEHFKNVASRNFDNQLQKEIDRLNKSGFKGKDINKTAASNLNKKDVSVKKLVTKYQVDFYNSPEGKAVFGEPRYETVKAERFSPGMGKNTGRPLQTNDGKPVIGNVTNKGVSVPEKPAPATYGAATADNPRYLYTGLGEEFDAAVQKAKGNRPVNRQPVASTGATDRTRAKFKSKYGGGNVAAGSKNVKPKDLPSSVLEQSDEYKKVYGNAISKGIDDVTAAAIAMKATKAAKNLFKKNPALMPVTEFFGPIKSALDDINKKPDYTR